jgi:hypothetical protein
VSGQPGNWLFYLDDSACCALLVDAIKKSQCGSVFFDKNFILQGVKNMVLCNV